MTGSRQTVFSRWQGTYKPSIHGFVGYASLDWTAFNNGGIKGHTAPRCFKCDPYNDPCEDIAGSENQRWYKLLSDTVVKEPAPAVDKLLPAEVLFAQALLGIEPSKIAGGSKERQEWLSLILTIQEYLILNKLDAGLFSCVLTGDWDGH